MPRRTPSPPPGTPPTRRNSSQGAPETVDPRWVLKALLTVVLGALVCGYLTLCLLFYLGQWQLVLHPKRTTAHPAAISGNPVQFVSFAPDDTAVPQLTGWWLPAVAGGRYASTTLLYLPAGDGSLADSTSTLVSLHELGINIFALDYRGFGESSNTSHPSEKVLNEDTESAWQYLHTSRGLGDRQIVPYGAGVGASLAARLAESHSATPALILDSPFADLLKTVRQDDRARLVPAGLLFRERYSLAEPLSKLHTPKLLLSGGKPAPSFQHAAEPRMTVEFDTTPGTLATQPEYAASIRRFLDQYLPPAPVSVLPTKHESTMKAVVR